MYGTLEILLENPVLHQLLEEYAEKKLKVPDADWQDRIMQFGECQSKELSRLHGRLIALGWLETRVAHDVFAVPGRLTHCYRITREGQRALRAFEYNLGLDEPGSADVEEVIQDQSV